MFFIHLKSDCAKLHIFVILVHTITFVSDAGQKVNYFIFGNEKQESERRELISVTVGRL